MKRVIDMDSGEEPRVIARFKPEDTEEMVKMYKADVRWEDISLDQDGDIILWTD